MKFDVLCRIDLRGVERDVDEIASRMGVTREEALRAAVAHYSSECVSTHGGGVETSLPEA